jgi:hypothetical protein
MMMIMKKDATAAMINHRELLLGFIVDRSYLSEIRFTTPFTH